MSTTPTTTDSLQSILLGDVADAVDPYPTHDRGRRAALRAIFAAIEALLDLLGTELLCHAAGELTSDEHSILRQSVRVKRQNGEVARGPGKRNLRERLRATAGLVARLRPEFRIGFQESGWHNLLSTLDVRDRLVHPENAGDMDVSETELDAALSGESWLLDNLIAVVQSGIGERKREDPRRSNVQYTSTRLMLKTLGDR